MYDKNGLEHQVDANGVINLRNEEINTAARQQRYIKIRESRIN